MEFWRMPLDGAEHEVVIGKVNIIAHSLGGLDARQMLTHLGMGSRVASLTTVGTPHRGTWCIWSVLGVAAFVAERIGCLEDEGLSRSDVAVFYRTHAQSRVIEEVFVRYGVPPAVRLRPRPDSGYGAACARASCG